jgi:surfeit locus 1 family protein
MRRGAVLLAVVLIGAAAVCVRLGFWQLSRLREKRVANVALAEALAQPPRAFDWDAAPESQAGRRIEAHGHYDERAQVLLGPRTRDGSPGVHVVTPLVVGPNRALLVDRGWLYSGDATWARPQDHPEPGERTVVGIAEPIASAEEWVVVERQDGDVRLLATRRLDRGLSTHLPYTLAPVVLRQLPGPGVPDQPARAAPRPANESTHLSYAVQWFLFATILVGGPIVVVASRRSRTQRFPEGSTPWSRERPQR